MKLRIVAIGVFVIGVALLTGSVVRSGKATATKPKSFVVQYLAYHPDKNGSLEVDQFMVRAVSQTGEWKETRYSTSGKIQTWGADSRGVFTVGEDSRQFFGEFAPEIARGAMRSEEELKNSPQLVGTEEIAGLNTYILRINGTGVEGNFSPKTGMTVLKEMARDPETKAILYLQEAVSVEFRDLSADEITLPELPVKFDLVNHRIEAMRAAHQDDKAAALSEAITKFRAQQ